MALELRNGFYIFKRLVKMSEQARNATDSTWPTMPKIFMILSFKDEN